MGDIGIERREVEFEPLRQEPAGQPAADPADPAQDPAQEPAPAEGPARP